MFAERMKYLESSGIRRLFELALKMKNPIDLSLGQPDFDVPAVVKEAAIEAIRSGKNRYTPTAGIPELRRAIANKLLREESIDLAALTSSADTGDAVIITSGGSGGLLLALLALADENCDVYIPDPYFVSYPQMIRLSGANIVYIDTYPDFRVTPQRLKTTVLKQGEAGSKKRKLLLLNTPANPTGIAYTASEIQDLVKTTQELGVQVITDEVYDQFCYDSPHASWLRYDPSAVMIRAFSKTGGMPGWRIGYTVAPEPILKQMIKLQQFSFVCINTPAQWACLKLLDDFDFTEIRTNYKKRRDFLCSKMGEHFKLERNWRAENPGGSFFAFPTYPAPQSQGQDFINACLKREVLVVPGNAFSQRDSNFRISFSARIEILEKGLTILNEVASMSSKAL